MANTVFKLKPLAPIETVRTVGPLKWAVLGNIDEKVHAAFTDREDAKMFLEVKNEWAKGRDSGYRIREILEED